MGDQLSTKGREFGLVAVTLAVSAVLGVSSLWTDGPTFDEPPYVIAGYGYLTDARFDINPEHPPLWKELGAVPLLFCGLGPAPIDPWSPANPISAETIYRLPRLVILLLFLLTGVCVYSWSRELWGANGATLSLLLYSFSPSLLAFGRLFTPDFPITAFSVAALYAFWRYCQQPTRTRLGLCAVGLAAALASRFPGLLLAPSFAVVLAFGCARGDTLAVLATDAPRRWRKCVPVVVVPLVLLLAALPLVALTYGFAGFPHYVTGFSKFFEHATGSGHHAFLWGQYSRDGWWYYFPVAIALKTTIPGLLAVAAAAALSRRRGGPPRGEYFLWIPAGILLLAASTNKVNLGVRLILPVYPLAFVAAGRLATLSLLSRRPAKAILAVLLAWHMFACIRVHPHYVSYFNETVGPRQGYRYLSDSNIDWGQDLPRLALYLERQGLSGVLLAYYGLAPPQYYGIRCQVLPTGDPVRDTLAWQSSGGYSHCDRPRLVAISVTLLKGIPFDDHSVYSWLEEREPVARIGYSILVYDVTDDRDASRNLIRAYESCVPPSDGRLAGAFEMFGPPKLMADERRLLRKLSGGGAAE